MTNAKKKRTLGRVRSTPRRNGPRGFRLPANVIPEDGWEEEAPNMRLSRAFVVVLVLHIVAVGGILAFQMIEGSDARKQSTKNGASLLGPELTEPVHDNTSHPSTRGQLEHSVRRGETLNSIAAHYGVSANSIIGMNRLPNPEVEERDMLRIPEKSKVADYEKVYDRLMAERRANTVRQPAPPVRQPQPIVRNDPPPRREEPRDPAPAQGRTHAIKKGENPYSIARKYGVSGPALMKYNNLTERQARTLKIGQVLKIPSR
ncbi:MAG: LysM peptidoglycan-binding domain-containing protein [Verrucomicrobiota bacterium]